MAVRKTSSGITLTDEERAALERLCRRRKVSRGLAQRAQIVLLAGDGLNNSEIADAVGVTRQTVRVWRERFSRDRLDGLDDEPRCGAPRKIGDDRIEEIVVKTLETTPRDATHWIGAQDGVSNVHDLHIWALSTTRTALAAHVVWSGEDADAFLDHVTDELEHDFGIGHVTLQLESAPCERAGACLAA